MTPDQKDLLAALKQQAELREKITASVTEYSKAVNDSKILEEELAKITDKRRDAVLLLRDMTRANSGYSAAEIKKQRDLVAVLKKQQTTLKDSKQIIDDTIKSVDKYQLLVNRGLTKGIIGLGKAISNLPNIVEGGLNKLRGFGLFEMDKAIKTTALNIGLAGKQSKTLRTNIKSAAENTIMFGANMQEIAQYQAQYSDETGRALMLGQKSLEGIAEIAKGTGLGSEGAAQMAASFEQQGISAERTRDFIEDTVNKSMKMGLNASKVVKNMQANMKLLNKYNFKGGVKGLQKMAETTTKLGIDMNAVTGMADKLFDIEGAVEMSAQLQVMGGAWAQMADPFHLMYMARNDMAGLTEEIGKAAEQSVTFRKETGDFEISALEMHRLRKVAEQMGVSYEDLATAAKNAKKFTMLKGQIGFSMNKDTKEFLANTAQLDENGKGYIEMIVNGKSTRKYLNELNNQQVESLMAEKKTLQERAKEAMTFDDTLNAATDRFKIALLPLVNKLGEKGGLIDGLQNFITKATNDGWFTKIGKFADTVGGLINTVGKFILKNPIETALIYFGTKILLNTASWVANGFALAQGFNAGAGVGSLGGALAKSFATIAGPLLAGAIGTGLGTLVGGKVSKAFGNEDTKTGDAAGIGLGALGAIIGGALAIGLTGGAATPLVIAAAAAGGGALGGFGGKIGGDYAASDAMFDSPIKDGFSNNTKKFGTNYSKNRGIIQGGKITPIDNKDDILAMKLGGVVDRVSNQNTGTNLVKHEFGDLTINGTLVVTTPGNQSMAVDLLKDPMFVSELNQKLQKEIQRSINQKNKKG